MQKRKSTFGETECARRLFAIDIKMYIIADFFGVIALLIAYFLKDSGSSGSCSITALNELKSAVAMKVNTAARLADAQNSIFFNIVLPPFHQSRYLSFLKGYSPRG